MVVLAAPACAQGAQLRAASPPIVTAPDTAPGDYTKADVDFVQGMIAHHAQAVRMAALVPARSRLDALQSLARRIDISQRDEIRMMQHWLADHHERIPQPDLGSGAATDTAMAAMPGMMMPAGDTLMPGMLTPEQMVHLAAADGADFDRLFLEGMIRHHEGALRMVAQLMSSPGATTNTQIFEFATNVDADQRAEIARMRALLDSLSPPRRP